MTAGTPHQAIYRRWRAQTFSEIVGQEAVVATLRNAVTTGQVAHAILLTGPRGTGKTSLARILAKALNCQNLQPNGDPCDICPPCVAIREGRALDLVEIDAASNRGIDAVRDLRERLSYAPTDLRRKVYILDEAHQITRDAWNALLKSLEEPPEFVTFMFASTHPQEFPPAILSRLQRFDVRRLSVAEITGKLERILAADDRQADPEAVDLVARLAAGGMRDAESILDQLLASTSDRIETRAVRDLLGVADTELVEDFVSALVTGDPATGIAILDQLEERGRDLRLFLDQVVDTLRTRLLDGLSAPGAGDPGIAAAARRIGAIDPSRLGPGGLRFQLELTLLAAPAQPPVLAHARESTDRDSSERSREATARRSAGKAAATAGPAPAEAAAPAEATAPVEQAAPRAGSAARTVDRSSVGVSMSVGDDGERSAATPRRVTRQPAPEAPISPEVPVSPAEPATAIDPPAPEAPASPEPPASTATASGTGASAGAPDASVEPAAPDAAGGPTPPATGAGDAAAPDPDDLDRLRTGWLGVVADVTQRNRAAKPLIAACRPIGVEGGTVTLGFPEEQGFLRDVAERRRPLLEASIGDFLGHPVAVRCVATNLDLLPALPTDPEAAHILSEAQRIFADDLADTPEVT